MSVDREQVRRGRTVLRICSACHRTDRATPLKDRHYSGGALCRGTVEEVVYVPLAELEQAEQRPTREAYLAEIRRADVDREQVRRELTDPVGPMEPRRWRDRCETLLAELEQAKRERDEETRLRGLADAALESMGEQMEQFERERDEWRKKSVDWQTAALKWGDNVGEMQDRLEAAEARLAAYEQAQE